MSKRRGRSSIGKSRRSSINVAPILKIAGLVVAVAGLACVVIFLIVPWIKGEDLGKAEPTPTPTITAAPTPEPTPIAKDDMSAGVSELKIEYKSINDPYVFGDEVVFSTGAPLQSQPEISVIAVYDMITQTTTEMPGIEKKYASLFEPKISENFIVYLDLKSEYGGNVMGYDRETGEMFVMREFLFGKPKVSLVGDYALWMQQTSQTRDKLYLYHLPSRESTVIEVFKNTPFSVSTPHMSDGMLVYVQPEGESNVLDGSSASTNAEIVVMPLTESGDSKKILFLPGTYVYDPMITGDYIVYLDGNADLTSNLMYCKKNGDTYTLPEKITDGILNYAVGDGFVVYTKEKAVYIYYFADGSSGQLSGDTASSRVMLGSASGKQVVWYDITDGFDSGVNIVQHITVP
ncbi:MAG: hypothetical protein HN948_08525 [Clostridia bacterium]|nr:hypothetical protein [Clostridia bacterium]MBT7123037.1 hypothetical protein [Clostridia bacterium]